MRSLKNPPLYGQPDRMTSTAFVNADIDNDGGAVHDNDGVGNKTAYLISQGGTFNGRTITGIDSGDPLSPRPAASTSTSSRGSPPAPSTPTSVAS